MENKINIAELLKDCPTGMELDCKVFDAKVIYQGLNKRIPTHPIVVQTEHGFEFELTQYGQIHNIVGSKCVIFPKGKTTWEGFHRPFKDGDIIYTKHKLGTEFVSIFQIEYERDMCTYWDINLSTNKLIGCLHDGNAFKVFIEKDKVKEQRFATEEEKERLFKAIKDNGYKWNPETKKLEKLIQPKFKVGDRIRKKGDKIATFTISDIGDLCYYCGEYVICNISYQDDYELVPNKFDISTLKPFDKVLIRDNNSARWDITFYELYDNKNKSYPYRTLGGMIYKYCIPYEGNEHLCGKTDDCQEFYKTWE